MKFYKYQGTGNDFVMIDNRKGLFPSKNKEFIEKLCHRRFGIGADGLILLENDDALNFKMVYFNADGNESTMCGNGGRCLVAFAHFLKIFEEKCSFNAIDGYHEAEIKNGLVKLKMIDVLEIKNNQNTYVLNTGSPHFVEFKDSIENFNVFEEGKKIRNSENYKKEGINVNFVEIIDENKLFVRTFERGVEDETYSCGTGVTAASLAYFTTNNLSKVSVKTLGGELFVYAEKNNQTYSNIYLEGPAKLVFEGNFEL